MPDKKLKAFLLNPLSEESINTIERTPFIMRQVHYLGMLSQEQDEDKFLSALASAFTAEAAVFEATGGKHSYIVDYDGPAKTGPLI